MVVRTARSAIYRVALAGLVAAAVGVSSINPAPALATTAHVSQVEVDPAAPEKVAVPDAPSSVEARVETGDEVPEASARILPLVLLGILARIGIGAIIRQFGKAALKSAAKSYLLKATGSKWTHIMVSRHKWSSVGGRSRSQVAEIMSNAMANGKHSTYGSSGRAMQAVWRYKNKTVVVTYSKSGGQISNGWVR